MGKFFTLSVLFASSFLLNATENWVDDCAAVATECDIWCQTASKEPGGYVWCFETATTAECALYDGEGELVFYDYRECGVGECHPWDCPTPEYSL